MTDTQSRVSCYDCQTSWEFPSDAVQCSVSCIMPTTSQWNHDRSSPASSRSVYCCQSTWRNLVRWRTRPKRSSKNCEHHIGQMSDPAAIWCVIISRTLAFHAHWWCCGLVVDHWTYDRWVVGLILSMGSWATLASCLHLRACHQAV